MERKQVMLLAIGMGLGLGVGLASSRIHHNWSSTVSCSPSIPSARQMELELLAQVVNGSDSTVTFDKFPYYLNEQTWVLLTNAAFVHLKQLQYSKFTRNLSPASKTILLTGPVGAEMCHQMLAKALAHYFNAKLLILDVTDFSLKLQSKYSDEKQFIKPTGVSDGFISHLFGLFASETSNNSGRAISKSGNQKNDDCRQHGHTASTNASKLKRAPKATASSLKRAHSWVFEDKFLPVALYKALAALSVEGSTILYLRDVETVVFRGPKTYALYQKMIKKLSGPVLVLGSRILETSSEQGRSKLDDKLASLFPYNIDIKPPEDDAKLVSWKSQLEEDMKAIQSQDNRNHISEVLAVNDVECDDLDSISVTDTPLLGNFVEEIVVSAISHHLMNTEEPQYHAGRLVISAKSLQHGLSLFQAGQPDPKDVKLQLESNPDASKDISGSSSKTDTSKKGGDSCASKKGGETDATKTATTATAPIKEVVPDNEFEKRIRPEIIPAGEIGVSFDDIGALESVKESLHELVMLPLCRPELFNGGLIKPCKGVLLFGPPGTGKTMLAKAVATEAGASFINVSMSTITSKWFGEDEKNVRALFTLAAKVAPTVIFIDEVDSMLGQRSRAGEHEAMRKIKNEFMAHWDGLLTKPGCCVLVLAATNRPFDLDDAIIRRFERRIMVGLPDKDNRERILRTILAKEDVSEINFSELASMTEGFSGSDLKNLCIVAAYNPIREFMKKEKQICDTQRSEIKDASVSSDSSKGKQGEASSSACEQPKIYLRPLNMEDLRQAKKQVSSSFSTQGMGMRELREWNELYGEGGSRKQQQLSYFL